MAKQVVVVLPTMTIRENLINEFLTMWRWPCQVIVVEDNARRGFDLPAEIDHYSWADIEHDLGDDSWIIPRRTDCIRSYGYLKAWQTGKPYIITLDDDCLPAENEGSQTAPRFLQQHLDNLQPKPIKRWHTTLAGDYPRGYPYEQWQAPTPIGISHGLWQGNLDYDSISQLHYRRVEPPLTMPYEGAIPCGQYFPMCGMNLAWRRELTPLLYFLLMGQDHQGNAYPFDRCGDIWAGIIVKKILDHLGIAVWSGGPLVQHTRASNVWANFDKEHAGIKENEVFWQRVDAVRLTEMTIVGCYRQIAEGLASVGGYWQKLAMAMRIWSALYE